MIEIYLKFPKKSEVKIGQDQFSTGTSTLFFLTLELLALWLPYQCLCPVLVHSFLCAVKLLLSPFHKDTSDSTEANPSNP